MKGLRVAEKQQEIYAKVSPPLNYQKKYFTTRPLSGESRLKSYRHALGPPGYTVHRLYQSPFENHNAFLVKTRGKHFSLQYMFF
jgi:hypothetical protein